MSASSLVKAGRLILPPLKPEAHRNAGRFRYGRLLLGGDDGMGAGGVDGAGPMIRSRFPAPATGLISIIVHAACSAWLPGTDVQADIRRGDAQVGEKRIRHPHIIMLSDMNQKVMNFPRGGGTNSRQNGAIFMKLGRLLWC